MNDDSPDIDIDGFVICPKAGFLPATQTAAKPEIDPLNALQDAYRHLDNQDQDDMSIALFKCNNT